MKKLKVSELPFKVEKGDYISYEEKCYIIAEVDSIIYKGMIHQDLCLIGTFNRKEIFSIWVTPLNKEKFSSVNTLCF